MAAVKPRAPIRRFDVFAEYNRLKGIDQDGLSPSRAKGYGIWVAKVVAAGKFGRKLKTPEKEKTKEEKEKEEEKRKTEWHELSGIPQTDKLFDKEIVGRMGKDF